MNLPLRIDARMSESMSTVEVVILVCRQDRVLEFTGEFCKAASLQVQQEILNVLSREMKRAILEERGD